MKKRFSLLLCLIMAVMMLTACGKRQKAAEKVEIIPTETPAPTATVTPTATPAPVPTAQPAPTPTATPVSMPTPVQIPLPKVTKNPDQRPNGRDCAGKRELRIYCAM